MDEFYDEEPEFFEGYSSDEESIEPQEEMEGMAEYGWQERASFNHPLLRNIEDRNITEQERYGINVNTYINKYKDRFVFNTKRLLDVILEDYEMVKYKNPIAYMFNKYFSFAKHLRRLILLQSPVLEEKLQYFFLIQDKLALQRPVYHWQKPQLQIYQ